MMRPEECKENQYSTLKYYFKIKNLISLYAIIWGIFYEEPGYYQIN